MNDDQLFNLVIASPMIALAIALVLLYQFVWFPVQAEKEAFNKKYPGECMVEKNQTVIIISANAQMTLYHPEKICQVYLGQYPDENNVTKYYANFQYESQAKYNKTWTDIGLSCKPKSFDELTGKFICMNGSIAKESS